ncbi:hypothetical protein [Haliangium sp.]|uniref:hypothetical protein n=1 Tax=Haliangium sp. TaxID=2663208 RepID=UPI003D1326F4
MPIYIVRWPDLSGAIVRAEDEDVLIDTLDEIANPDGCVWEEYHGPLFIDFKLAAKVEIEPPPTGDRPLDPDKVRVTDIERLAAREEFLTWSTADSDTGSELLETITRFAFPETAKLYWGEEEGIDRDALERAVTKDAMKLVEYTWRRAQLMRSSDPQAQLAVQMDAPVRLLRWWQQQFAKGRDEQDASDALEDAGGSAETSSEGLSHAAGTEAAHRVGQRLRRRDRLIQSGCVTQAWQQRCHWCGHEVYSVGRWPQVPNGWIEHLAANEESFLFCSNRCSSEAEQDCPILAAADCPHENLDEEGDCRDCGSVVGFDAENLGES